MSRTPEQVAADEALTLAIDQVHHAYDDDIEGVLNKYVVLAQRQWWDDEGDQVQAHYHTPRDGDLPLSDQLGLITFADTRYRARISNDD